MRAAATRSGRLRRWAGAVLGTCAIVALLLGLVTAYAQRALFDSDQFAARAAATLADDAVKRQIAIAVTDGVVIPAERDLVALRPLIQGIAEQLVGGAPFRSLLRASVADVHRSLFERDADTVTLTIANLGIVLQGALERLEPDAAARLPADVRIAASDPPAAVTETVQAAEDVEGLAAFLLALALLAGAGALALSRDRRASLRRGGAGLAFGALLLLVVYWVAHARLLGRVTDPDLRAALDGVWDAYLLDLRNLLLLTAGCGAVVAAAAASVLRPVSLEAPLRHGWRLAVSTPRGPWWRAARALALVAAGAVLVADPLAVLRLLGVVAGILLIYAGVQEVLRLVTRPAAPGAPRAGIVARNAVVAAAFAALAIVGAGSLFLATGGASQSEAEAIGCNGHRELCDRPLDEVTLPATHNSFSAADYPNWLFAQHERGIAAQLSAGIRGFLIDTYWGRPGRDGRVVTDLSAEDDRTRAELVAEIGPEAVDAALRIRDSAAGGREAASGPRDIYMCHGFCEVGARLLRTGLEEMRDYLVAHPHQVIVVINQNEGVGPREFARVVEESGLGELVHRGPIDEWPTLGEMIDADERVVMLAENPPFDVVPWYHEAFASTQETPYRFTRPAQLTDPELIPASCRRNRGAVDAPMFLVNHWIDTSPAPRPSNAARVNARAPLLRRARRCAEIRDRHPNLLAVDFYATGDVVGAAEELNGL